MGRFLITGSSAGLGLMAGQLEMFGSERLRQLERVRVHRADVDEAGLFDEVFEHARAVFATLAEAVDAKEWFDVTVELPADYRGLIPARSA